MTTGRFVYERCPLKHHVRRHGWLEACRRRLQAIRAGRKPKELRRLRYFTFCALNAIDVLMLDLAKVIRPSKEGRFDTVFFFTRSDEAVGETRKSIPGAIGFPGDFVDVVLVNDPAENDAVHGDDDLGVPEEKLDSMEVREELNRIATHREFVKAFPFDVMNLDLEGYLFKAGDQIPGKMLNAFRRVFELQRRPLKLGRHLETLNAFTLLFTTKVGPKNLRDELLTMLRLNLEQNLHRDPALAGLLDARTGNKDVITLLAADFDAFFRLSAPKILAQLLMDTDWYVDPARGIDIYQFEREPAGVEPYRMLHIVMDVRRHEPSLEHRAPGTQSAVANGAYASVVQQLFERSEITLTTATVDCAQLERDLNAIDARRRKYQNGDFEVQSSAD